MTNWSLVGKWSFTLGLIVAILAAFVTAISVEVVLLLLFILGLLVGFLNITEKNSTKFLTGLIALFLIGVSSLGALAIFGTVETYLAQIVSNFLTFVGAAGLVVSIKVLFETSRQ
ncbi:MAG: hypothetical protein WD876_04095 [Candidatus Pacearchaeota archaeon]